MNNLDHLTRVTGAFLRDVSDSDPVAPLADIRWTVADLAAHLGEVHRWAAGNARTGKRGERQNVPELSVPLAAWYEESRDILLTTLEELDPAADCYTLSTVDRSVAFWHRRQLFETLVHLWDLRSAADATAPPAPEVPPEVHADGVSELFDVFLPRSSDADRVDLGGGIRLIATDTGHVWSFGSDWRREGDVDVAATVSGPAGDLLLWAWNRARARDGVRREGDADVIRRFEKAHVRP